MTHLLLEHGADPNQQDGSGRSPLMAACHWNLPELVDLLLDKGADIDLQTSKEPLLNPLYVCLFKRRLSIAKILVAKGASLRKVFDLQHVNLKAQQGFNLEPAAL
jgi:ankyrin repeat protein